MSLSSKLNGIFSWLVITKEGCTILKELDNFCQKLFTIVGVVVVTIHQISPTKRKFEQ